MLLMVMMLIVLMLLIIFDVSDPVDADVADYFVCC